MKRVWERTVGGGAWRGRAMSLAAWCTVIGLPGQGAVSAVRTTRALPVSGTYVLTQADGGRLPYAFSIDMGRPVNGQVLGAQLVLGPNGTYTSDVTVRMDWGDVLPIPGLSTGPKNRVLHGEGNYTASDSAVVLSPSDWLTKRLATRVLARADGRRMVLTAVDRPPAGERYALTAAFERVE